MGIILFFAAQAGAAKQKAGTLSPAATLAGSNAITYVETGTLAADTTVSGSRTATIPVTATPTKFVPDVTYQVAFASQPLSTNPTWIDLSTRLRRLSTRRGRSYEFDRYETGTMDSDLANRDSALSPANTSSPYNPVLSTRPVRAFFQWIQAYPVFRGITEGFPQTYRAQGKDSEVQMNASDLFYALNQSRFTPGSTTMAEALTVGAASTEEQFTVASTALPMPQAVPFTITLDAATESEETVEVTEILDATTYTVIRSEGPKAHALGAPVTTQMVSFGEELSGTRIRNVLERVGFSSQWYDLDTGQSLISPSEDLAQVNPLEHINLITDAEFGRFFASQAGLFTFRDRHSIILDYQSAVMTFHEPATGSEVPFNLEGELSHSEEKLYNRVRITIQGGTYAGQIIDIKNQSSIDNHFERMFERTFPYATLADAESAAQFVLIRNAEAQIRLPGISVRGAVNPSTLWPILLAREIGDRVRFRYQPEAGGSEIDKQLAIEGIAHSVRPGDHIVTFQCTEVDSTQYWILGQVGASELDTTTRVGF